MQAEQEEKEQRRKEKQEAHLYTYMKVAREEDLREQIGNTRHFDLVDHDAVKSFRVAKTSPFLEFKKMVHPNASALPLFSSTLNQSDRAITGSFHSSQHLFWHPQVEDELGIPMHKQRYWLWAKRQNHTFRPNRPLMPADEAARVMDIKDNTTVKHAVADLKLLLEPVTPSGELARIDKADILLFFKLYIPETQVRWP